jgi:hypothetical protein
MTGSVGQNAKTTARGSFQLVRKRGVSGDIRLRPILGIIKIPRCPKCLSANPRGLDACPACGEPAPERTDEQRVGAVLTQSAVPLSARILFALAAIASRLRRKIAT